MRWSELQQELRVADPAAILVAPRVLERVIRQENQIPGLLGRVPHWQCFVVDRHILFRHVEQDDLDLEPDRLLPSTVILLVRPSQEELSADDSRPLLLKYWRLLFHASLHLALQTRREQGGLSPAAVRQRIEQIGPVEFEEVRRVLIEDGMLPENADERLSYIEFACVYLELQAFAPNLLPSTFPALLDRDRVLQLLRSDVDADTLLHRSRLAGAPDPVVRSESTFDESHDYYWKLIASAERASRAGNTVRAAILHTRAARVAPAAFTQGTRIQAGADLTRLVERLKESLHLGEDEAAEWLKDLPALLDKADQGSRPIEAVLLYELQKVCLDHERDIYALDLVEWLQSRGRRPIKRPLPSQRLVHIVKHLRGASQLLNRARLSDADRQHFGRLMQGALDRSEERLRERFRPILVDTFDDVGLRPTNPPERTAYHKVIEELLDRISEYGFLTFSDLRDTLSRNQLKLPDLSDSHDFLKGDALKRMDRRLASHLDGVYRPAEIYLRWLEHFTALFFGTSVGRLFTRYIAIPFGGAYAMLKGGELIVEEVAKLSSKVEPSPPTGSSTNPLWVNPYSFLALGFFLMALIHVEPVRRRALAAVHGLGHGLRYVFVTLPARVLNLEEIQRWLDSGPFQLLLNYVLQPLTACALLRLAWPDFLNGWREFLVSFLLFNLALNHRLGRAAVAAAIQGIVSFFHLLGSGLIPGMIRLMVMAFKHARDMLEYVLFSVDEWLRFRSGDSQWSLTLRTALAFLWFPISYLARFYLVVLIEPMVNPVKLPISILFAKFVYPLLTILGLFTLQPLGSPWVDQLAPFLTAPMAWLLVIGTFYLLPDAVTFLFWEMRENWRLYRANRPETLQPLTVGSHGETVRRLLHPGFHSGTLPKLYARLRKAERSAVQTGNWQAVRVCGEHLHEVERALQRLLDREVVTLIQQSPHWKGLNDPQKAHRLSAGHVALASNRIRLELKHPDFPEDPVWLDVEDRSGWLVAGVRSPGWLTRVTSAQRQAVETALAGLYKLAGIDLIREQIDALRPREVSCYDLTPTDLVFWVHQRGDTAVYYELINPEQELPAHNDEGEPLPEWPALDARRLIFNRVPIAWEQWVSTWQKDQDGGMPTVPFEAQVKLLPAPRVSLTGP